MEIDLDALLALAGKMPKGPWKVQYAHAGQRGCEVADRTGLEQVADRVTAERAQYIAAVNPVAVTELVRRLKAAEQDAARYRFLRDRLEGAAFGDDDDEDASITFAVPMATVMSASCDDTIDSAMAAASLEAQHD